MSEIVPTCGAELHSGGEVLRVCTLAGGHEGPHWASRPVQRGYEPIAWIGDDTPEPQPEPESTEPDPETAIDPA